MALSDIWAENLAAALCEGKQYAGHVHTDDVIAIAETVMEFLRQNGGSITAELVQMRGCPNRFSVYLRESVGDENNYFIHYIAGVEYVTYSLPAWYSIPSTEGGIFTDHLGIPFR